jgi:hypothetical protein
MEPALQLVKERLGEKRIIAYRIQEKGRSARGKCKCPECGKPVTFSACSDVGGVWVLCPKCGQLDF